MHLPVAGRVHRAPRNPSYPVLPVLRRSEAIYTRPTYPSYPSYLPVLPGRTTPPTHTTAMANKNHPTTNRRAQLWTPTTTGYVDRTARRGKENAPPRMVVLAGRGPTTVKENQVV